MSELREHDWPQAHLNNVQKLRVLAAGLPGTAFVEGVIDAPIERVWGLAGDLVHGTPQIELSVRSTEILVREGDHLTVRARTIAGFAVDFDVELRFGWCVMQSRTSLIGMAAVVEEEGRTTRFAHFEGTRRFGRVFRPLFRWNVEGDIERIGRILRTRG